MDSISALALANIKWLVVIFPSKLIVVQDTVKTSPLLSLALISLENLWV